MIRRLRVWLILKLIGDMPTMVNMQLSYKMGRDIMNPNSGFDGNQLITKNAFTWSNYEGTPVLSKIKK